MRGANKVELKWDVAGCHEKFVVDLDENDDPKLPYGWGKITIERTDSGMRRADFCSRCLEKIYALLHGSGM